MKKIPKIKLQLTNEDEFDSSKLKNKTVLFFYPKALTGGCSVEVADFQNKHKQWAPQGGVVAHLTMGKI